MKTLYEDERGWIKLSYVDSLPFIHVQLDKLSPKLYKEYLVLFNKVLTDNSLDKVYSTVKDEKTQKFNELFGFEFLCEVEGNRVMEYSYVSR